MLKQSVITATQHHFLPCIGSTLDVRSMPVWSSDRRSPPDFWSLKDEQGPDRRYRRAEGDPSRPLVATCGYPVASETPTDQSHWELRVPLMVDIRCFESPSAFTMA